jgi:tRNA (cytidine/uridine-2'-O-)-methyltransferase
MHIALYQPDIPQNTGTILRIGACLNVPVHIIKPAGFALSSKGVKRAGLDYADQANLEVHQSYEAFMTDRPQGRLILLSTKAEQSYIDFAFECDDILLLGRESAGVPQMVHSQVDARVKIPLVANARSLNIAVACAMVLGEGLRQTGSFAKLAI